MNAMLLLGTAFCGAIGAALRFYLSQLIAWKGKATFPLATLVINVTGSALLGILHSFYDLGWMPQWLWQLLGVGLIGAYTTFSTFSYELYTLIQQKRLLAAAIYLLATIIFGALAAACCIALVHGL